MHGLNFKFGSDRREDWRCCFCCHVRTATIFLGVWHLMLHVLTLSVIAVILRHPELVVEPTAPALPTPQSEYDASYAPDLNANSSPNAYRKFLVRNNLEYQHLNVSIVVMFSTFAITLLMVYGAIKGKPSYLMPFLCLQLFDFCIASLTALSYLCYLPDMHRLVSESPKIPLQAELLTLSPQALAFIVLITFLTAMVVKAYFIGVVWSCYKYLTLRWVAAQRTIHLIEPDVQDLLPDYETACTKFPPPPPSYTQATQHQPPPSSSAAAAASASSASSPEPYQLAAQYLQSQSPLPAAAAEPHQPIGSYALQTQMQSSSAGNVQPQHHSSGSAAAVSGVGSSA